MELKDYTVEFCPWCCEEVVIHAAGFREPFVEYGNDGRRVALAIDQFEDRGGGLIEFSHAFRIEDDMAVLSGFPLQAIAATKGDDGVFLHAYTSRVVCQAALSVTV